MRILYILIIIALFNACSTASTPSATLPTHESKKTAEKWNGITADELVKKMGTPSTINTEPDGSKVYMYVTPTYHSYPPSPPVGVPAVNVSGNVPVIVQPTPTPAEGRQKEMLMCTRIFTVNKDNIVVEEKKEGGCPGR